MADVDAWYSPIVAVFAAAWALSIGGALLIHAGLEIMSVEYPDDEAVREIIEYEWVWPSDPVILGTAVALYPFVVLIAIPMAILWW